MAEPDSYLTISSVTSGLFKDRGSKFLAFAHPVYSEDDAKSILDSYRKQYHNARHHCFAWVLGAEGKHQRANDDGEPSHSAGDPILNQITSRKLTNVMVIVVRYFGGTLLGVGGLINAYRCATGDALDKAKIIKKEITRTIRVSFPYEAMSNVMRYLKENRLEQEDQDFRESCKLFFKVPKSRASIISRALENIEHVECTISKE